MQIEQRQSGRFTLAIALFLTLAAVIIGGLALQTWRTANAHRDAARRVLHDYASFAAWSFASRVRTSTFYAINPVFAGADAAQKQPQAVLAGITAAADSIRKCRCGIDIDTQYIFIADLGSEYITTQRRDSTLDSGAIAGRTRAIAEIARASLAKGVSSREPGAIPYRWATGKTGDESWIAFYGVHFRSADDAGVIFGFSSRSQSFASAVLSPASARGLLPASLLRSNSQDSLLSVVVSDAAGAAVYRSSSTQASPFTATESLGAPDTALIVSVSMNPAAARRLIIGGLPPSPVRTILPLVSLAIVLLALALYVARRQETQTLELRARLSEARLAALRGQLNPHFLFNVLNSIAMLARKGDTGQVVQAVTELAGLLRTLLKDSPAERIPLSEELRFIEQYLSLEGIRFQDGLQSSIHTSSDLGKALVPAFILQPLVENALRHGVAQSPEGATVDVRSHRNNGSLVLEVVDTGAGFEGEPTPGIGLRITRERLAQIYGARAGFAVSSSPGQGTTARVTLPFE